MPKGEESFGVLCDTSVFIRLAIPKDPLHQSARAYLKYLVENGHTLFVSTIALAEYAVRDSIENLPLRYLRIVPFNVDHSQKAGEFAAVVFRAKQATPVDLQKRAIIPNDTKMFGQAEVSKDITHYLTADQECKKVYDLLNTLSKTSFTFLHLSTPYNVAFGELDLESD